MKGIDAQPMALVGTAKTMPPDSFSCKYEKN